MVLAVAAAAGRQSRLRILNQEWPGQIGGAKQEQRNGDDPGHDFDHYIPSFSKCSETRRTLMHGGASIALDAPSQS
jgi:hypothetical protein